MEGALGEWDMGPPGHFGGLYVDIGEKQRATRAWHPPPKTASWAGSGPLGQKRGGNGASTARSECQGTRAGASREPVREGGPSGSLLIPPSEKKKKAIYEPTQSCCEKTE